MLKNITNSLVAGLFLIFATVGCGSGGGHIVTQKEALNIISSYASSATKAPTLNDYKIAGIAGIEKITPSLLSKINERVHAASSKTEVDELSEIQAIVNTVISENPPAPVADTTPPVITLVGSPTVSIVAGAAYSDAGATAMDNKDGNITPRIVLTSTVNAAMAGTYTVKYNVRDAANNAATEVVRTVTVNAASAPNQAPTANAGADMNVEVNKPITIVGLGTDPEGKMLTYKWTEGATQLATTAAFTYTPTTTGVHTLALTVTDNKGLTAVDSVKITATATPPANQAPTANAGANMSVEIGKSISLVGIGNDPERKALTYKWAEGTKLLSTSATFNYTPATIGAHTLTLTVTDNKGLTGTDTVKITAISPANQAPTANAGADMNAEVNKPITVVGLGTDPEGKTLTYKWTEGAAQLATTATFTYVPATTGAHTLTLTVTDEKSLAGTDTIKITVTSAADTKAPAITLKGLATINLNVGDTYTEEGATATDNVDTSVAVTITGTVNTAKAGTYTITYTATDKAGNKATKTRTVNVAAVIVKKELWFSFKSLTGTVDVGGIKVNSLELNTASASSLVYTDGSVAPGIEFITSDNFEGRNTDGPDAKSGNDIVPYVMLSDGSWFIGQYDVSSPKDGEDMHGTVKLKGLNPGDKYTLKLGAARKVDGKSTSMEPSRDGNYTVNGVTKIFNADDANNRELTFSNVTVTNEGEITLAVSVADHTSELDFAYLGWMKLIDATSGSTKVINPEKLSSAKSLISSAVNGSIDITYITAGDSKRDDTINYPEIYTGILSDLKVAYVHDSLTGVTAKAWTDESSNAKPGLAKAVKDAKGVDGANTIIEYSLGANDWNNLPVNDQNKYATIKPVIKKGITELQRLLPNAKIVLINPIGTYRPELKKAYRDIAKELNLPMLENPMDKYRDNPAEKDTYFQDNIHPNLKGAKLLVKTILQTVTEGQARTIVDSK